jgi:osmotically-inducible protein OsmY
MQRRAMILAMLVLVTAGCAPHTDTTVREYFDDVGITTRVKAAIAGEGVLSYLSISVETFRGIVLLSGFVDSEHQKQRAIEVTRTVSGVREVRALLVVKYLEGGSAPPPTAPKP